MYSSDIRDIVGNLDGDENEKTHNFMIGQTAVVWQTHTRSNDVMTVKKTCGIFGVLFCDFFFVRAVSFDFVGAFLLFLLLQLVIPYKCDQRGQLYYIFFCFYSQFGVYTHSEWHRVTNEWWCSDDQTGGFVENVQVETATNAIPPMPMPMPLFSRAHLDGLCDFKFLVDDVREIKCEWIWRPRYIQNTFTCRFNNRRRSLSISFLLLFSFFVSFRSISMVYYWVSAVEQGEERCNLNTHTDIFTPWGIAHAHRVNSISHNS